MSRHQPPRAITPVTDRGRQHAALRELYTTVTSGAVCDPRADPLLVLTAYRARLAQQLAHERFITAFDVAEVLEASGHHEPARIVRDSVRDIGAPDTRIVLESTPNRPGRPTPQKGAA